MPLQAYGGHWTRDNHAEKKSGITGRMPYLWLGVVAGSGADGETGLVHANGDGTVFVRALAGSRVNF